MKLNQHTYFNWLPFTAFFLSRYISVTDRIQTDGRTDSIGLVIGSHLKPFGYKILKQTFYFEWMNSRRQSNLMSNSARVVSDFSEIKIIAVSVRISKNANPAVQYNIFNTG